MFVQQLVLVFAGLEFTGSIDEKCISPVLPHSTLLAAAVKQENSHGNRCGLEEIGRQPDDRAQQVLPNDRRADQPVPPAAKQHSVWTAGDGPAADEAALGGVLGGGDEGCHVGDDDSGVRNPSGSVNQD